jgi:hypothetical protein
LFASGSVFSRKTVVESNSTLKFDVDSSELRLLVRPNKFKKGRTIMNRAVLTAILLLATARASANQNCESLLQAYPHTSQQELDPRADVIEAKTASGFFTGAHTLVVYVNNRAAIMFHKKILPNLTMATSFPGATVSSGLYSAANQINAAVRSAANRGRALRLNYDALQTWANGSGECLLDGRSIPLLLEEVDRATLPPAPPTPATEPDRSEPVDHLTPRTQLNSDGARS